MLTLPAVPDGTGTLARITFGFPGRGGSPGLAREHWQRRLPAWLDQVREVAEGRGPHPPPGLPQSLRAACAFRDPAGNLIRIQELR